LDYAAALAWLTDHYNLEQGVVAREEAPDLHRMIALMDVMGDPHRTVPIVHVTGTNGKGSTARMVTALLSAAGLRVGGSASPHIQRVNERVTVDNAPLDDDDFAAAVELVARVEPLVVERIGERPTYFEVTAAAAFGWFADEGLSAAVVEVGLGGRYDATNVADGAVAAVTNVSLDHLEWIGPGIEDIAAEKAGIVKPGSLLVLGETAPELVAIFSAAPAREVWQRGVDFDCTANQLAVGGRSLSVRTPAARYDDLYLPVHGAHQGDNAALAVAAAEAFAGGPLGADVVTEALASVTLPGRFEVVGRRPLTILDGAHNAAGARAATATLMEGFVTDGPTVLVLGCNRPRDPADLLESLLESGPALVVATAADWAKAVPASEVAAVARELGAEVVTVEGVASAIERAVGEAGGTGTVLITGSLYVVGEARSHLVS